MARVIGRGAGCRDARAETGAPRHVGDLVQELVGDGPHDSCRSRSHQGARGLRQDQVPGRATRRTARANGRGASQARWSADVRDPPPASHLLAPTERVREVAISPRYTDVTFRQPIRNTDVVYVTTT